MGMTNEDACIPQGVKNMARLHRVAAVALMLVGLAGCVVAPAAPPPAYGYAPSYYGPSYAVYPPPVSVGIGVGFGGWHHWR
jgi:hypothetical protein